MSYPFAALLEGEAVKRSLMLLAVEPRLKGVCVKSGYGSVTSTLLRSFCALMHQANPSTRIVKVPLNVTEDRLLGGIDVEQAIATGEHRLSSGLLSQADGGVLLIDCINLLDGNLV